MQATDEQKLALERATSGESFKILAYAGSGKTTTLRLISEAMPQRKGLYLAFNKAIATEAAQKFHRGVDCRTFHSLAFRQVPRALTDKLSAPRLTPQRLAEQHHLTPIDVRRKMDGRYEFFRLTAVRQATLILNALTRFCATASQHPHPRHFQMPDWLHESDAEQVATRLYPALEQTWHQALSPSHPAGISHDIYLKYWALSRPVIPADYILFDEAQDSDPLMLGVLMQQSQSQVIYVGDPYQQIYQWRGAVNAMQRLPLPESRLTRSFRFGDTIAGVANTLLRELKETVPLEGQPNLQSAIDLTARMKQPDAILCRTNARAMGLLIGGLQQGHNVALQADTDRLGRFVDAAAQLKLGRRVELMELSGFQRWQDVQEYCDSVDGTDLKPLVKLVDEHGTEALRRSLKALKPIAEADYVISTAHKAKGLEWNRVQIENDYNFKLVKGEPVIQDDEIRLLYVAATRARTLLNGYAVWPLIQTLAARQGHRFNADNTLLPVPKSNSNSNSNSKIA